MGYDILNRAKVLEAIIGEKTEEVFDLARMLCAYDQRQNVSFMSDINDPNLQSAFDQASKTTSDAGSPKDSFPSDSTSPISSVQLSPLPPVQDFNAVIIKMASAVNALAAFKAEHESVLEKVNELPKKRRRVMNSDAVTDEKLAKRFKLDN